MRDEKCKGCGQWLRDERCLDIELVEEQPENGVEFWAGIYKCECGYTTNLFLIKEVGIK